MKKLIVFALWGTDMKYIVGLARNVIIARTAYPDYICRVYIAANGPVPNCFGNIEIMLMKPPVDPGYYALFWRFLPVNEPYVSHLIFRDCDSRIEDREVQAVRAWEASGMAFHAMRDVQDHLTYPVSTGLWGMKNGYVPDFHEKLWSWMAANWNPHWTKEDSPDECFVRDMIWADKSLGKWLVHGLGGEPFPKHQPLKYGQFCGHPIGLDDRPVTMVSKERLGQ